MVPSAVVELDHAHAALGESAREETVGSVTAVARFFHAVEIEHGLRLVFKIGEVRDARLHFERQLVLRDARGDLGIVRAGGEQSVHATHFFDDLTLRALADALGIADVVDGVTAGLKLDALETTWEHAARPLPRRNRLLAGLALRSEHDETRQILRLCAESVEQPRAHARAALDDRAGVHERVRRVVVNLFGLHRTHHAQIIRHAPDVREKIADFDARLAAFTERRDGAARFQHHVLQLRELLARRKRRRERLPIEGFELRLPIKRLELRRSARHAEENHALGAHRQMRLTQRAVPARRRRRRRRGRSREFALQQRVRDAAEAVGALGEKRAAIDAQGVRGGIERRHGQ